MAKSEEHQVPGYEISKARIDAQASQLIAEKGKIFLLAPGIHVARTRNQIVIRSLTDDEVATEFALNKPEGEHCHAKFDIESGKWRCVGDCLNHMTQCEALINDDDDVFACACLPYIKSEK